MKLHYLLLAVLGVSLLSTDAEAAHRGYGRSRSGFNLSLGFGSGYGRHYSSFGGSYYNRGFSVGVGFHGGGYGRGYGSGHRGGYYDRPRYYAPVHHDYYYAPRIRYYDAPTFYHRPTRPYFRDYGYGYSRYGDDRCYPRHYSRSDRFYRY